MEIKNLVIGALIGLLVGLAGGYLIFNGSNQENIALLGSQVSDLTQQVSDLTQQLTAEEADTVSNLEAVIQQKNIMIANLRAEIESLEPEPENPIQENDSELGRWESISWMEGFLTYTENITITESPITIRWTREPGEYGIIHIYVYFAETNGIYFDDFISDFDSDHVTLVIPPGKYYISAYSEPSFTLIIENPV